MDVNVWAILVSVLAAFFAGGFWYSKSVFGATWSRANNQQEYKKGRKHPGKVFIGAFIFYLISAFMFAILIGPQPELYYALKCGAEIGIAFVATSFGINYLFANRSYKLFLIDGTYHILQFLIYGLVLGLWH